jgi:hypothetical protein
VRASTSCEIDDPNALNVKRAGGRVVVFDGPGPVAIAAFVAARRLEPALKAGLTVSPATVNHDLRHLKSVLGTAQDWGYLPAMPKVRMEREPKKLPTYGTPEHFAQIYAASDKAKLPDSFQCVSAGD